MLHSPMPGKTSFKSASDDLRTAFRESLSVDNARNNQFRGTSYEKLIDKVPVLLHFTVHTSMPQRTSTP